ncbi:universal stress protein UspA [Salinigranum rubrum]|uniref:Universal stress protein UspA n=1 Tax=Salinigranum rubrum TaxID=755307 RepID=A0A2I8VM10_9EURY|nr:HPP family protein [Salinigranum rubrum]AUV82977.1 universal stress protein UspA [Salinigranum rubrum]
MDRETLLARVAAVWQRARRIERRELVEFRRWAENTNNLIHLSILLFVPLLIGGVTIISNALTELSFLLFPPLASGTYTLFADPEGRYASPVKFVVGLTIGALAGWIALELSLLVSGPPTGTFGVLPAAATLSILLTGGTTWALNVEEPAAFSTALLVLVTNRASPQSYVLSVAVFGTLVAGVFYVWREQFYEKRARYLYSTVSADDRVLVPMRGPDWSAETTAAFGTRLAAAHDAGRVVLLGFVEGGGEDENGETTAVTDHLESVAERVRESGVACEVVVTEGEPVTATLRAVRDTGCDLVVTPYEADDGALTEFVRGVFGGPSDAIAFRAVDDDCDWRRVLVLVARPGDTAHAMIDFAERLVGERGTLSVCTCIGTEVERRPAETRLANLVETVDRPVETRVARSEVTSYITANAGAYDLVIIGSSGDRSAASRFVSPPTFERIAEVETDVAVVDRGDP